MSAAPAAVPAGMGKRFDTPAGADQRYGYVKFSSLSVDDQLRARSTYMSGVEHLPDEEYLYPVKLDGKLASARRHMPFERAKELYEAWTVREVHDS